MSTSSRLHEEFNFYRVARMPDGETISVEIDGIVNPLQSCAVVLLTAAEAEPWLAAGAMSPIHSQI